MDATVTVPTVERGLRLASVCDTRMAGDAPVMRSTCGLRMPSSPSASRYWRWHSLNSTSTSSVDLPDPDSPVNATSLPFGMSRETPLRLPSHVFRMQMFGIRRPSPFGFQKPIIVGYQIIEATFRASTVKTNHKPILYYS